MTTTGTRPIGATTSAILVGGGPEALAFVEPLLPEGTYDVDFAEHYDGPYGVIRRERPDLVILCLRIEDQEGFRLLTMLRLDPVTASIPVLTYTTEFEGQPFEGVDEDDLAAMDAGAEDAPRLARH